MNGRRRSDGAIWWLLFSAGGVCFAVVLPGTILLLAVLAPLGLLPTSTGSLSHEQAQTLLASYFWGLPGLVFVGAAICLPLFHAAHRIYHGAHDLQWRWGRAGKWLCYGGAALLSLVALVGWGRLL